MTLADAARAWVRAGRNYRRAVKFLGPRNPDTRIAKAELFRAHRALVRAVEGLPVERDLFSEMKS